jgi:hypothetical protein
MYRAEAAEERATPAPTIGTGETRTIACYRVAKLVTATGPMLCIVRALSPQSATLDIELPFDPQDGATLEIGKERMIGALVRTGERRGELRARDAIDLRAIVADPSLVTSTGRRSLPRIEIAARCRIDLSAQRIPAEVRDISTDGIKIYCEELLSSGDAVRIVLKGIDTSMPGIVRWCDGDFAGIEFAQKMPISRLNAWLATQADCGGDWSPPIVSKS